MARGLVPRRLGAPAPAARGRAGRRRAPGLGSRGRPSAKREVSDVILLHTVSHFN